jgi:hypothetical protein
MELRKIYSRVRIHKPIESLFKIFVIYSNLKLQIDNSLGVVTIYMDYNPILK